MCDFLGDETVNFVARRLCIVSTVYGVEVVGMVGVVGINFTTAFIKTENECSGKEVVIGDELFILVNRNAI